ncbi:MULTISPECIES: hypothetical protein [Sphingobacterium]|uniref:hypothetical protein n=1 Tax=Sphingobacterium TaxID=28453 RepID=UPI00257CC133|nr:MULTISPECIES: hypothetical protein [Sphingobacterium]
MNEEFMQLFVIADYRQSFSDQLPKKCFTIRDPLMTCRSASKCFEKAIILAVSPAVKPNVSVGGDRGAKINWMLKLDGDSGAKKKYIDALNTKIEQYASGLRNYLTSTPKVIQAVRMQ